MPIKFLQQIFCLLRIYLCSCRAEENLQTKEFSEATEAELEQMSKMDSNLDIAKQSETAEENQQPGDDIRKTEPSPTVTVDPAAPTQSRRASEVNLY